ncbi:MAG: DUF2461 domain-containing protein [Chitinophagales bacterium]|nr:DUF2461 domain-containing protein [Chitinophagales bacterium]
MKTIDQKDLLFFQELSQNNHREWFQTHKSKYDFIVEKAKVLASKWINALGELDADIAINNSQKAIFRIYRDVRFSKDKTPYKTHIGMAIGKGGRKARWAGWYFQIAPNESFLAAGKWAPDGKELKALRQEIDYNWDEFERIISAKEVKKTYTALDTNESLKTAPKGYDITHPAIEILKLKHFIFEKSYTDEEILRPDFIEQLIRDSKILLPFVQFLNRGLEDAL